MSYLLDHLDGRFFVFVLFFGNGLWGPLDWKFINNCDLFQISIIIPTFFLRK